MVILMLSNKRKSPLLSERASLYPEPLARRGMGTLRWGERMSKLYHQTDADTRPQQRPLSVVNTMRRRRRWDSLPFMGCGSFTLDLM